MIAKAGLGLIGLSAISIGGVAVTKPHLLGMDYMPEFHTLSKDSDYSGEYNEATHFGKKYGKYLVGVTNENQKTDKNQKFWEWAFRRLSKETITQGKFINTGEKSTLKVSKPFADKNTEDDNAKALNQVCKAAYKTKEEDFKDNDKDKFQKSDVWKYCTPGALVNVTEYSDNSKIGGGSDKAKLLSVKNSANDWFWKIRNEEFWSTNSDNTNTLSGSTASGTNNNEKSIFKKEYETNSGADKKDKRQTIKQLCEEAYKQNTTSQNSNNKNDALKFCVLETSNA